MPRTEVRERDRDCHDGNAHRQTVLPAPDGTMSSNAFPARAVRLVTNMGDNLFLWIVDASDPDAIACLIVHFHSREQATLCNGLVDDAIKTGHSIDIALSRAAVTSDAMSRGTFGDPEQIVEFLGGESDQALRWNARKMLAEMAIARD